MVKRKTPYGSIGIEQEKLDELKVVKAVWEHRAGRKFTWGDFLSILVTLHQPGDTLVPGQEGQVAHMNQDSSPLEERDQEMEAELAQMLHEEGEALLAKAKLEGTLLSPEAQYAIAKMQMQANAPEEISFSLSEREWEALAEKVAEKLLPGLAKALTEAFEEHLGTRGEGGSSGA